MSDLKSISRLQEEQEKSLKHCEAMIDKWKKFKEDYETVEKLLTDLPKKLTHDVMVPISPLAFMPGRLIHTNEIMVLLGDNWFAERSATQAVEIAKRRLKSVEDYLGNLHKEHEKILSHMAFTTDVVNVQKQHDYQEIKEELTEKDKQRQGKNSRMAYQKATKGCVKKVDLQSNPTSRAIRSREDENLFSRLEELEKREQINNELENERYFSEQNDSASCNTNRNNGSTRTEEKQANLRSESATTNTSARSRKERVGKPRATNPCSAESVQNGAGERCGTASAKNSNDSAQRGIVKRVSWKENVVERQSEEKVAYPKDESATIYFTHSTGVVISRESHKENITSPADIAEHQNKELTMVQPSQPAATGKGSVGVNEQPLKDDLPTSGKGEKSENTEKQTIPKAFSDVVVEHDKSSAANTAVKKDSEQKPEPRKISKFKARRMQSH